jgi:hypothetical protein
VGVRFPPNPLLLTLKIKDYGSNGIIEESEVQWLLLLFSTSGFFLCDGFCKTPKEEPVDSKTNR